jgi:hypothetical protein
MTEKNTTKPSKSDELRRTFTVRESLRDKLGYDATAALIRRMYDLAEANKPRRTK